MSRNSSGCQPVLLHQAAQRRAVAPVVILLQAERLVMRDLEEIDDVIADAHIDLLPEIEVMRIKRVVEIEHPGRHAPEIGNGFGAGTIAGGLFTHHRKICMLARFAPRGFGNQIFQCAVVKRHRIALAFHCQPQHAARQLVGFHRRIADRFQRQPRLVEGRFQTTSVWGSNELLWNPRMAPASPLT